MERRQAPSRDNEQRRAERPTADSSASETRELFRAAMRRMAATVTIVSTGDANGRFGMTATSVTSVSMDPPSMLVSVNRHASIYQSLIETRAFCVNILSSGQENHCFVFSGAKTGQDRFRCGDWRKDGDRPPYLEQAQANIFCLLEKQMPYGTHMIFIGRVWRVRLAGVVSPLVYMNGGFLPQHDGAPHSASASDSGRR